MATQSLGNSFFFGNLPSGLHMALYVFGMMQLLKMLVAALEKRGEGGGSDSFATCEAPAVLDVRATGGRGDIYVFQ